MCVFHSLQSCFSAFGQGKVSCSPCAESHRKMNSSGCNIIFTSMGGDTSCLALSKEMKKKNKKQISLHTLHIVDNLLFVFCVKSF